MFELNKYLNSLTAELDLKFGKRLLYVGLQGSYLRGEADENSDIDIMVVIGDISISDMDAYREIIINLGNYERSCGFICGKSELENWNPLEICHLVHTTRDLYGRLCDLVPSYTAEDERNYIKMSLNNLYHEICHGYIHSGREKSAAHLPGMYKCVFFILQNMYYVKTGEFIMTKAELADRLDGADREVLLKAAELKNAQAYDFESAYELIYKWCKDAITNI